MVSLVNRTPCVFPIEYFDAVSSRSDELGWTFYDLCGCPQSLAILLVQLAHLAAEKQRATSMRWVTFDNTLVDEIEESLKAWTHSSSETPFQDAESMHKDVDRLHCSEAWRNGLLLYINRVFRWKVGEACPMEMKVRARTILDHVSACRDGQFVARQALLPLFFAGCELADQSSQLRIRDLCHAWNERTRYHLFAGAVPLLEEVWAQQLAQGATSVWWGQVIDTMTVTDSWQELPRSVCFG